MKTLFACCALIAAALLLNANSAPLIPASQTIVCHDRLGVGPDITLTQPPPLGPQLKAIDGCYRGGECFYNCGKE